MAAVAIINLFWGQITKKS